MRHMGNKELVTIIIPVYNIELYLRECINSVIHQTYNNLEIILVDDGSQDNSGKICDDFALQDKRIQVIHKTNGGAAAARNRGIDAAHGEFVYFLDSDDYIELHAIARLVDMMQDNSLDFVVFNGVEIKKTGDEWQIDDNGHYCRKNDYSSRSADDFFLQELTNGEWIPLVQLVFFRRSYLSKNHLKFYEGIVHEDELFSFYVYQSGGNMCYIHDKLFFKRTLPGSITAINNATPKSFYSLKVIYYEIAKYIRDGKKTESARLFIIMMAKGVIRKYSRLDDLNKTKYKRDFSSFKVHVLFHGTYGSSSLRMLCLPKLLRSINEWKIKRFSK